VLSDPNKRLLDCSCKTSISSVQTDLQLRFRIGVGLVNEISLPPTCCRHPGSSVALGRRQLAPLLQEQFPVSLQIGWAYDRSSVEDLAYGPEFYTRSNPVSATRASLSPASLRFPFALRLAFSTGC